MNLPKGLSWFLRITPLRISLTVALIFSGVHFTIEGEFFEYGLFSKNGMIHLLDLKALDLKIQGRTMEDMPEPQVVVAAIDEKSVAKYGLWPWNRTVIADFITAATEGGAKVIAFDAVFADEDRNASYTVLKSFMTAYDDAALGPQSKGMKTLLARLEKSKKILSKMEEALNSLKKDTKSLRGSAKKTAKTTIESSEEALKVALEENKLLRSGLKAALQRAEVYGESISKVISDSSPDEALATAIGKSPQTILGYINFYNRDELVGMHDSEIDERMESISSVAIDDLYDTVDQQMGDQIISMLQPSPGVEIEKLQITKTVAALTPLPILAKQAKAFAYFNAIPDEDGPIRKIRLLNKYQDKLFPALSLLSAAMALDADIRPLNGTLNPGTTIDGIALGPDQTVPTDLHGRFYINYYKAPEDYFPTFAISDIIDGTVPPEKYKGKVMLFGMTAKGLFDLRPTPFSPITPGVYIHAQAIQNILDDLFLERYYGIVIFEILFYLLLGLLMGLILPRIPLWASGIATFAMVIGLFWVDLNFIFSNGTWLLNVLPTLEILTIFMGTTLYGYFTEGREKRKVRQAFQFYMTKSVVDEMLKAPDKLQLGGERRVCTVLFSDIRGFTTISEALTPEELVSLLNSYLTPMTDLVFKYDGTLDKYMGDAIMAIFGAPVAHDDHPVRACYSALDMMASLKELQAMWQEQGLPIIDIGIGLNTGPMSVGNMGSEIRFDYTVMGDNVNLGSRLESINKQYGTNIIISEYTWAVVQDDVFAREIDSVRVKGKKEPVTIYELMGRGKAAGKDLMTITRFEEGIALYKGQKWDEATAVFEEVRKEHKENDFASAMYIDRCIAMKANPPGEAWDGVYTMTTK